MKLNIPSIRSYRTLIGFFLLAFLLWLMVKMNRVYEYSVEIPIIFTNIDPDRIFKHPLNERVEVEFTGKGIDLIRLKFYDVVYQLDLSDVTRYHEFDLSAHPEYVNFPGELSVNVKSILRPRSLVIELDKKTNKKLPLEVDFQLVEPPGMILVGIVVQPESIQVTGPAELFNRVNTMTTEKKVFKEPLRTFTEIFEVKKFIDFFSQYDPQKVNVTFDIQRLAEKEVPSVPVNIINKPDDLEVIPLPSTATIYIKGGEKLLANLEMDNFEINIDFKKVWHSGVQRVKADLNTDADVLYMETRPPLFELIVQKKRRN